MKTYALINKRISPVKICVFIVLVAVSSRVNAEYYMVTSPDTCCTRQVVVVHKTVYRYAYHPKRYHRHYYHPIHYRYAPHARCMIWVTDPCGCCGCSIGHWEPCRYRSTSYRVYYVQPADDLSTYEGEVDDRATADDTCPGMQVD